MAPTICADDYGMCEAVDSAIDDLVRRGIVGRVSALVSMMDPAGSRLPPQGACTGIHFDLRVPSRGGLGGGVRMVTGNLRATALRGRMESQLSAAGRLGLRINYFDSHYHIHALPGIAAPMLRVAQDHGVSECRWPLMDTPLLMRHLRRLARHGFGRQIPKMLLLYMMSTLAIPALIQSGLRYHRNVVAMPLATTGNYDALLLEVMRDFAHSDACVIVHPALAIAGQEIPDSYGAVRYREYEALRRLGEGGSS